MHGYVFYPDGGARGQREHNGGGIHGYMWSLEAGSKSIGHTTFTTTPMGYAVKNSTGEWLAKELKGKPELSVEDSRARFDEFAKSKVAAVRFYDAITPFAYGGTNNSAELKATIELLHYALQELELDTATSFVIRQDSMYVVDGINKHLPSWIERKFIRRDGTQAPNSENWMELARLLDDIKKTGVVLRVEYVEAHSDDIGNNSADQLATAALYRAKERKLDKDEDHHKFAVSTDPDYWAGGLEHRHPLMMERFCFMRAGDSAGDTVDYVFSSQGREVSLNGKRTSDDCYCLIRTKPVKAIEAVRARQNQIPREIDYFFQVDVDSIYSNAYRYLNSYGGEILHRKHDHVRHLFVGDKPVTEELHPPYLASVIFNNADVLYDFLNSYKETDSKTLKLTDITDTLYDFEEKPVKVAKGEEPRTEKICTLKPSIVNGYSKHKVKVQYNNKGEIGECEITLRAGVDFPGRNVLKRIESTMPRIYVLTNWLGGAFMFATVIESGDDLGIWCGMNSSLRIIGTPEK